MNPLENFSLEITGKDIPDLAGACELLPPGTRVNVTFLETESHEIRVSACRAINSSGMTPVPHIAARRLSSETDLREYLRHLAGSDSLESVFLVGGDPAVPSGPYREALDVVSSGLLGSYGVRNVGIAGYPEGHPAISSAALEDALDKKLRAVAALGLEASIITQFAFDRDPVLTWIEQVRDRGVDVPIRIGVPGPAGIKRLLSFARRFGVSSSAGIAKKYGFSLTNLLGTAGPDKFIEQLQDGYDAGRHGEVGLHFYTFGSVRATAEWTSQFALDRR